MMTTISKIEEVKYSIPYVTQKRGLDPGLLYDALAILPVERFFPRHYQVKIKVAHARIGQRDPTDVDLLALALKEKAPIWSQDKDFENCGIEIYTTESLLKKLDFI